MDYPAFEATINKFDWRNRLMAIIFDNAMVWIFDRVERHFDSESNKYIIDRIIPPEEYLELYPDIESIGLVENFQMVDKTDSERVERYKLLSVRNVENIQGIVFCPEDHKEIRHMYTKYNR